MALNPFTTHKVNNIWHWTNDFRNATRQPSFILAIVADIHRVTFAKVPLSTVLVMSTLLTLLTTFKSGFIGRLLKVKHSAQPPPKHQFCRRHSYGAMQNVHIRKEETFCLVWFCTSGVRCYWNILLSLLISTLTLLCGTCLFTSILSTFFVSKSCSCLMYA